jgi:hypothetical protein
MNTPARMLHATLDLLDRQLLDRNGMACGNVDDIELTVNDDGTVYVTALLTGPGVLSYRLRRKKLGLWLQQADRRLYAIRAEDEESRDRSRIPIELAYSIAPAIHVAMDAADIAAHDIERWASEQFIGKIPWARDAPE